MSLNFTFEQGTLLIFAHDWGKYCRNDILFAIGNVSYEDDLEHFDAICEDGKHVRISTGISHYIFRKL